MDLAHVDGAVRHQGYEPATTSSGYPPKHDVDDAPALSAVGLRLPSSTVVADSSLFKADGRSSLGHLSQGPIVVRRDSIAVTNPQQVASFAVGAPPRAPTIPHAIMIRGLERVAENDANLEQAKHLKSYDGTDQEPSGVVVGGAPTASRGTTSSFVEPGTEGLLNPTPRKV